MRHPVDRTVGIYRRVGDLLSEIDLVLRGGIVFPRHGTLGVERHQFAVAGHGINITQIAHRHYVGIAKRIGRSDLGRPQQREIRHVAVADVDRLGRAAFTAAVVGDGQLDLEHALLRESVGGIRLRRGRTVGEHPFARDDLAVGIGRLVGEGHLVADVDHHRRVAEIGRRHDVVGQHGDDLFHGRAVAVGAPRRERHRVFARLIVDDRIGFGLFRPVAFAREAEVPEILRDGRTLHGGGVGEGSGVTPATISAAATVKSGSMIESYTISISSLLSVHPISTKSVATLRIERIRFIVMYFIVLRFSVSPCPGGIRPFQRDSRIGSYARPRRRNRPSRSCCRCRTPALRRRADW